MHWNILQATGARKIFCFVIITLKSDWHMTCIQVSCSPQMYIMTVSNSRDINTVYEKLHGVDDKLVIFKNECQVAPETCASCFYLHM